MATKFHATQAYSPRLKLSEPVEINEVAQFISGRSNQLRGTIKDVLSELAECFVHFFHSQQPVKLLEVGIFRPVMARDGSIRINFKPDKDLLRKLNMEDTKGAIKCKEMIGKSDEEFIARWNKEHPDDKIE